MMSDNDSSIVESLADEFADKLRRGESPSISEYADAHPDCADEIRELFPSIQMIEQLASRREQQRSGKKTCRTSYPDPERLGDYRILRRIGQGGMGVVYEAVHETLDRRVAVKMLPPQMAASDRHVARFVREAKAAARLHHTNIVPVFGVGEDSGTYFYVMQLIDGAGLDSVLDDVRTSGLAGDSATERHHARAVDERDAPCDTIAAPKLTRALNLSDCANGEPEESETAGSAGLSPDYFRRVAEIGVKVGRALQYAHEHDVLHRDVKPANILVEKDGDVWVTDFGLAKLTDTDDLTASGDVVGTLRYVPPESFHGQTDTRSDVYGLGLTLYELVARRPAFEDDNRSSLVRRIIDEEPPPLRTLVENVPRDLDTIICKAISKEPRRRYQAAGELADDLQRYLDDRPIHARRVTSLERLSRWTRRNPSLAALSATSVILLLAVTLLSTYGYIHLRWAYTRVQEALGETRASEANAKAAAEQAQQERDRAKSESERARKNLDIALRALEEISDRLAARQLPQSIQLSVEDQQSVQLTSGLSTEDAQLVQSLLRFYDEFATNNAADEVVDFAAAKGHQRIGDICNRLGHYEQAAAAYQQALRIAGDFALFRVRTLNSLGAVRLRSGDFRGAIAAHQRAQEELAVVPPDVAEAHAYRYELALTLNHLVISESAEFINEQGRRGPRRPRSDSQPLEPPDLQRDFRRALELLERLVEEKPDDPGYRLALARCHRSILSVAWASGDDDLAAAEKKQAIFVLEQLRDESPDDSQLQFELADTLAMTPYVDSRTELPDASVTGLLRSIELTSQLHQRFPTAPDFAFLLASSHRKLGAHYIATRAWSDAATHLNQSTELLESVVASSPTNPLFQVSLARARWALAESMRRDASPQQSRDVLDKAIADYCSFRDSEAGRRTSLGLLVGLHRQLARTLHELGEDDLAAQAIRTADQLRESGR